MANPALQQSGLPLYQAPATDPLSAGVLQSQQRLQTQVSADQIASLQTQAQVEALTTANSIRNNMQSTMHLLANQAESLSATFIGDEVAQTKKQLDNSSKAV